MLPAYPRPHNHSPPQPFFLTDVDQWFNIRLPASLSSINYRHQIGTHYFLRRNPHIFPGVHYALRATHGGNFVPGTVQGPGSCPISVTRKSAARR